MKKLILSILFLMVCSTVHAATTWYLCSGGGTWSGTNAIWTSVGADQVGCTAATGHPATGDSIVLNALSGQLTIGATPPSIVTFTESLYSTSIYSPSVNWSTYTLTTTGLVTFDSSPMTNTSSTIIPVGVTLSGTPTGTGWPTIKPGAAQTLTSGGFTWPGSMNFNVTGTITLTGTSSTWQNNGLTTISAATLLTPSTATLKCNGGLTQTSSLSSSSVAIVNISGGTWTGAYNYELYGPLTLGTMTLSGSLEYGGSALTLTTGSTITGTTNQITMMAGNVTITSNSVSLPALLWWNFNNATITLSGNANISAIGVSFGNLTMSGAYNATIGSLQIDSGSSDLYYNTFVAGQTITVTNQLYLGGVGSGGKNLVDATAPETIQSSSGGSAAYIKFTGSLSNLVVVNTAFKDINASGSTYPIYDYGATAGMITGVSSNITPKNASNFGGASSQGYAYGS